MLKTLIVTSALTFVPENYDRMIGPMAQHPSVVGLLVLENRSAIYLIKALFLILSLSAPRMGITLIKNFFGPSMKRRKQLYESLGKKVWVLSTINCEAAAEILKNENIDLVINSRTRFIYKKNILQIPKLGCLNIHHGLLPEQRGLMCDFWAHLEDTPFGFSIHQMTPKIDDGPILKVVPVESPRKNYLQSIFMASIQEAKTCLKLLDEINEKQTLTGMQNSSDQKVCRKNPSLKDGYRLQMKGIHL